MPSNTIHLGHTNAIRKWILAHRGILTRVAREHGVSPQHVQRVAYSTAFMSVKNGKIETALRSAGWPEAPRKSTEGK